MLQSLSIRDVVLIDRLDIAFENGLAVLTGETGAGKSILLDSLALALGARSDAALVRAGAEQAAVSAIFALPDRHPARALLIEQGLEIGADDIVLRRVVGRDGRSRAFVDDQPVGVGLLKRLGALLVEIHGQFDSHGLLDPSTHLDALDAFAAVEPERKHVSQAYAGWRAAAAKRQEAEAAFTNARAEEDFLRHAVAELDSLAPRPGEEDELAARRQTLMHAEKLAEALVVARAALEREDAGSAALQTAARALGKVTDKAGGLFDSAIAALERALNEAQEAESEIERAAQQMECDPQALDRLEERLFALRGLARKYAVGVDQLAEKHSEMKAQLAQIESGGADLVHLARAEQEARARYLEAARKLAQKRADAAKRLDVLVAKELPPLKLEKAGFLTRLSEKSEADWNEGGIDRATFEVSTNPGMPPGPLSKIASGGELARFMLALKVILAKVSAAGTLIFDEVDTGIGGATAAAVGERLARLARDLQVLVVTHSPQVAAMGGTHFRVAKSGAAGAVSTRVQALEPEMRREEIARMLAGAKVTDEARAAADALLQAAPKLARRKAGAPA